MVWPWRSVPPPQTPLARPAPLPNYQLGLTGPGALPPPPEGWARRAKENDGAGAGGTFIEHAVAWECGSGRAVIEVFVGKGGAGRGGGDAFHGSEAARREEGGDGSDRHGGSAKSAGEGGAARKRPS